MSVPRSDTETRSASFWSFNHCLLSFTPSSLACWWFHLLFFLLQNAMLCFIIHRRILQGFISDIMPPLPPARSNTRRNGDGPLQVQIPYIVYSLDSQFTLCCLCFFFHGERVLSGSVGRVTRGTNASLPAALMLLFCVETRETANDG